MHRSRKTKSSNKVMNIISSAIKLADDSYFFEDYTKQAQAVLKSLQHAGYTITKARPSPYMIKAGIATINLGLVDAKELASKIFINMHHATHHEDWNLVQSPENK